MFTHMYIHIQTCTKIKNKQEGEREKKKTVKMRAWEKKVQRIQELMSERVGKNEIRNKKIATR